MVDLYFFYQKKLDIDNLDSIMTLSLQLMQDKSVKALIALIIITLGD